MSNTKITLAAATILQLEAGTHEAVRDGGNLYILFQSEDGFKEEVGTTQTPQKSTTTEKVGSTKETPKDEPKAATTQEGSENWTEDDMTGMESKDLLAELGELGINPDDTKGRNTNKKLRDLILDYWANNGDVVDDTKNGGKEESKNDDGYAEIPKEEWKDLEEGTMVMAQLDMDGEDGEKLWEAEVVGWKKPKGSRDEQLYVHFTEDDQEDYLREGDKLFEFSESL